MPRTRIPLVRGSDPEWTRTLETTKGQGAGGRPAHAAPRPVAPAAPARPDRQSATAKPQPAGAEAQAARPIGSHSAPPVAEKLRVEVRVRPDPRQTERLRHLSGPKAPEKRILALAAKRATARLVIDPAGPPPSEEKLRRDGTPSGRMVLFLPRKPVAALRGLHDPFELLQLSELLRPQAEPVFRQELDAVLTEIEART